MSSKFKLGLHAWKSLLNRNFLILVLINTLMGFANKIVAIPVNKFAADLGIGATIIGILATVYSLSIMVTRPIAGIGVDKFDNKKFMIVTLMLRIVCFLAYAITGSVPMYIVSRVLHGCTFALVSTALPAVAGKAVDRNVMATALGIYLCAPMVVNTYAPILAMDLYNNHGAPAVFLTASAILALAIVVALFVKMPKIEVAENKVATKKKFALSNLICVEALPVFCINFFIGAVYNVIELYAIIHGEERGISTIVLFFSVYSAVSVICRLGGGIISDLFGDGVIMVTGLAGLSVACILVAYSSSALPLMIAGALYALGQGGCYPVLQSLAVKSTTEDRAGLAMSTYFLAPDVAGIITGIVAGAIAGNFGYATTFAVFAIFPAIGIVVYFLMKNKLRKSV